MKLTTEQIEEKIKMNWANYHVCYYFAQVLSGEVSIDETLKDLLSLDPDPMPRRLTGSEGQ